MNYLFALLPIVLFAQNPNEVVNKKYDKTCEQIVEFDKKGEFIEKEFDLYHPDVSRFMAAKMNTLPGRGEGTSPGSILRHLMKDNPAKTLEWLLDNYDQFSPTGLSHVAYCLVQIENRECYQLLSKLLQDRRIVLNERAARIAPQPYHHDRVCDCAYGAIVWMLYKQKKLPQGFPLDMASSFPYEQRDKFLKRFLDWWLGESDMIIQNAPPLSAKRPSLHYKMEAVMQKAIPPGDR